MATQKDMKRLEQVLEIFGADSDRWPVSERAELEALIEHDDQARRLIGEAHALSSLMAHAPAGADTAPLTARILAQANTHAVEPSRPRQSGFASFLERLGRRLGLDGNLAADWSPAAVMTAALALGIYLGASGMAQPVVGQAVTLASIAGTAEDAENLFGTDETELWREESRP